MIDRLDDRAEVNRLVKAALAQVEERGSSASSGKNGSKISQRAVPEYRSRRIGDKKVSPTTNRPWIKRVLAGLMVAIATSGGYFYLFRPQGSVHPDVTAQQKESKVNILPAVVAPRH